MRNIPFESAGGLEMPTFASFLELRLKDGKVHATYGSGPWEKVLAREITEPWLRICMKDPEVVDVRVQCGTAKLEAESISYTDWDEFQLRGSSLRMFAVSTPVVRWLANNSETVRAHITMSKPIWLGIDTSGIFQIERNCAPHALDSSDPSQESILIDFNVIPVQMDEMIALLGQELQETT